MPDLNQYPHAMEIDPLTGKPMQKVATPQPVRFVRLSTEPQPTEVDGVRDGDELLVVDTKETHVFYKGTWYLQ